MTKLLSLCMIVKNEEQVLARCLDSVNGLVDEIIIVDTGSTDSTRNIALRYTTHVLDFQWNSNFAAARNTSIQHATGKWILILDADEYLNHSDHSSLRDTLESIYRDSDHLPTFLLPIHNFTGKSADASQIMISSGARIFPNFKGIYYINPIHEQLTKDNGSLVLKEFQFPIYHDGYTEVRVKSQNKSDRNLNILESMKTPQKLSDPYFCFILANGYNSVNNHEAALLYYRTSFAASKPQDAWYSHLLDNLISTELQFQHLPEAYKLITEAINRSPKIADYHCYLGVFFEQLGYLDKAILHFKDAIQIAETASKDGKDYWKVQPSYGTTVPLRMIGMIYFKLRNNHEAVRYWVKLLQLQPKNYNVLRQLFELLIQNEQDNAIIQLFQKLYPNTNEIEHATLFQMGLLAGSLSLSKHYLSKLNISLSHNDQLSYELLSHSKSPIFPNDSSAFSSSVGMSAAIIYNDYTYLKHIVNVDNLRSCEELWLHFQNIRKDSTYQPLLSDEASSLLADVLLLFKKYNYVDTYYDLLQILANSHTINQLANRLYSLGYWNEAIELFAILLDNDAVSEDSLANIGQWQLMNGNPDDGILFMEAALSLAPTHDLIGWVRSFCSTEQSTSFLDSYLTTYAEMKNLSFLL
ncbi:glycosyltransferase [Paenibacillus sp. NPDC057967]|uniref:glycosyltransferase n=1 Tax=Paenibacillus sp. NPDC057967 TaxID=3346293 RepID=UPI0036D8D86B